MLPWQRTSAGKAPSLRPTSWTAGSVSAPSRVLTPCHPAFTWLSKYYFTHFPCMLWLFSSWNSVHLLTKLQPMERIARKLSFYLSSSPFLCACHSFTPHSSNVLLWSSVSFLFTMSQLPPLSPFCCFLVSFFFFF